MASEGRVAEASGRVRQVGGQKKPQVDLQSSWTRYETLPPNKANLLGGGHEDLYNNVVASWLLYTGGRVESLINAAQEQKAIEGEAYRRTKQQVAFQVRRAFSAVENSDRILAYQVEAEQQLSRHLEVARVLADAGKAAPLDVLRAEVQLANVRQALLKARNAERQTRMALNNAMGRPVDAPLTLAPTVPITAAVLLPPTSDVYEQHPDIRAARLAVRRTESEIKSARAARSPSLSLLGSYNYEGSRDPFSIRNNNIGLALAFPLIDGGTRSGAIEQANARRTQAQAAEELIHQRINLEVDSARLSVAEAYERISTTQKTVEQAAEALRVVQEKYRVGMGSSTEVIDAQVALTQARANQAASESDYNVAVAQWEYAAGIDPLKGTEN
jgi:outer membrane protein TolC